MRARGLAAALLAVLLSGCVDPGIGLGSDSADGSRVRPLDVAHLAFAAAGEWREDAVLVTVRGGARTSEDPGVFSFGSPGSVAVLDGGAESWQFTFAVPGTVAMLGADVTADGKVSTRSLDLSSFTPATGEYKEYFEMTPVEDAWLDTERIIGALRANASTAPFTEGSMQLVEYALVPDVRSGYAWRVKALDAERSLAVDLDAETLGFLEAVTTGEEGAVEFEESDPSRRPPSGLAARGTYGVRNGTDDGVARLRFDLGLSEASRGIDLRDLVVRYEHDRHARAYTLEGDPRFRVEGGPSTLAPGGRATLELALVDHELPPRGKATVTFETPKGAPVVVRLEAPMTYGKATLVRFG